MKLVSGIVIGLVVAMLSPWIQHAYPTPADAATGLGAFLKRVSDFADNVLVLALVIGCLSAMPAAVYFAARWWFGRSGGGIEELRVGTPALVLALGGVALSVGTYTLADGMVLGTVVVVLGGVLLLKGLRELKWQVLAVFGG